MKELFFIDPTSSEKYTYWVGTSAQNNWDIITQSKQNDLWFHLHGKASAHVILKTNKEIKDIPKKVLYHCAQECKNNSKFKNFKSLKVIYTEIKNVKKGTVIGQVCTKKEKYIQVD